MSKDEFIRQVTDEVTGVQDKSDLVKFMLLYTPKWNGDYDKFLKDLHMKGDKPFPIDITPRTKSDESFKKDYRNTLNEAFDDPDEPVEEDVLSTTPIDYD